jgi:hypothetical protein
MVVMRSVAIGYATFLAAAGVFWFLAGLLAPGAFDGFSDMNS